MDRSAVSTAVAEMVVDSETDLRGQQVQIVSGKESKHPSTNSLRLSRDSKSGGGRGWERERGGRRGGGGCVLLPQARVSKVADNSDHRVHGIAILRCGPDEVSQGGKRKVSDRVVKVAEFAQGQTGAR